MMRATRERTYRDCSVAGASPIGLLVALFDRLATDLRRAADAIRAGDTEARCRAINHGILILGQLDSWVDHQNEGQPARQISALYSQLRAAVMQASIHQSATILDEHIETLLDIRTKWQELDSQPRETEVESDSMIAYRSLEEVRGSERVPLSLSA